MAPRSKTRPGSTPSLSLSEKESDLGTKNIVGTLGGKTYTIGSLLRSGEFYDYYACSIPEHVSGAAPTWYDRLIEDEGSTTGGILKVVRNVDDNDLIANEAGILDKLFPKSEGDVKFYRYLPRVVEHFQLPDSLRGATIFVQPTGYIPLSDIIRAYPEGIDFRDMVWMFKRTLVGIGFAHLNGVSHGLIIPSSILVHPVDHGAKIFEWSMAVEAGSNIKAIFGDHRAYYPEEVFEKTPATPATDIYMAAKCVVALLGGNVETNAIPDKVPVEIRQFLDKCLMRNSSRRPQNAWDLHEEFDGLLQKLVGKPTYRLFEMPA